MAERWRGAEFISLGFSEREAVRLRGLLSGSPDRLATAVCRLIDGEFRERKKARRPRRQSVYGDYDGGSVLSRYINDDRAVANVITGATPVYELCGNPKRWRRASLESLTRGEFYMYQPQFEAFDLNGVRYEMRLTLPPHTYRYEAVPPTNG